VGLAAGREGAGHGEENDFLVGPFFGGVVFLRAAAGGGVGVGYWGPSMGKVLDVYNGCGFWVRELEASLVG